MTSFLPADLQCDRENREHLKYLTKSAYCVTTNHSKEQDMLARHKTTN